MDLTTGFKIGTVRSIEIRVHWSWIFIFTLITWSLAEGFFGTQFPEWSDGERWGWAAGTSVMFFGSVLFHELSHAFVAQSFGMVVPSITLFIFGGVSNIGGEMRTAGQEFRIAIAGPLSSWVLAAIFVGLALVFADSNAGEVLAYLGLVNFVLGAFNLLPGFPLDGGRIFRAAVWKSTGDYTKATRWATTGGKWLAYALIAFGLLSVFQGNLGGLWLVLIGWFLRNAAIASYQQHLLHQVLEHVRASDAMTPDPETVPPDLTLQELVDDHFLKRRFHAFPVASNGRPLGLITLGQVKEVPREEWSRRTVAETMTSVEGDGVTVRPDEPMTDVLQKMEKSGSRRVLVTRDGHLEGIITTGDVAGWLQRARELEG